MINSSNEYLSDNEYDLDNGESKKIKYHYRPRTIKEQRKIPEPTLFYNPKLMRRNIINDYERPVSDRESWWRSTIKDTPSPLRYNLPTFLNEFLKRPNTYRFKTDGRKHEPTPQIGKGEFLLPGAYSYEDFGQRTKKLNLSYGFKNHEDVDKSKPGLNPENNLSPFSYETDKYLAISCVNEPVKHSFFKSKEKRKIFPPKDGPCPGDYESTVAEKKVEISSCFKSASARFTKNNSLTPGPGTYEPVSAWINSKQSQDFNRKGVFFSPSAKVKT